jgi:uncharacterized protein (TIGR04222 family)
MDILDLRGPEFLAFYLSAAVVAVGVGWVLRRVMRGSASGAVVPAGAEALDALEVAYLASGPRLAINTAIASLYQRGAIRLAGKTGKASRSIEPGEAVLEPLPALERQVLRYVASSPPRRIYDVHRNVGTESVRERPRRLGLLLTREGRLQAALLGVLPLLLVLAVGLMKIQVGAGRHRPVGILIAFCVITVVVMAVMLAKSPRRTAAGDAVVRGMRSRHAGLRSTAASHPTSLAPADFAMAVGLFGATVLVTGPMSELRAALGPPAGSTSSCGSGGCGSGSCGSGGCGGGGCGGGGCGGCGGGGCGS